MSAKAWCPKQLCLPCTPALRAPPDADRSPAASPTHLLLGLDDVIQAHVHCAAGRGARRRTPKRYVPRRRGRAARVSPPRAPPSDRRERALMHAITPSSAALPRPARRRERPPGGQRDGRQSNGVTLQTTATRARRASPRAAPRTLVGGAHRHGAKIHDGEVHLGRRHGLTAARAVVLPEGQNCLLREKAISSDALDHYTRPTARETAAEPRGAVCVCRGGRQQRHWCSRWRAICRRPRLPPPGRRPRRPRPPPARAARCSGRLRRRPRRWARSPRPPQVRGVGTPSGDLQGVRGQALGARGGVRGVGGAPPSAPSRRRTYWSAVPRATARPAASRVSSSHAVPPLRASWVPGAKGVGRERPGELWVPSGKLPGKSSRG